MRVSAELINSILMRIPKLSFTVVGVLIVAGCGGGGGDDDSPPSSQPPTTPPAPESGLTVSGVIRVTDNSDVDADLNDPLAPFESNDDPGAAQTISNPVVIGGYINRPGEGEAGRSRDSGDLSDFYRVDLAGGQSIHMIVADADRGDPDLYLWDQTGTTVIDFSINVGEFESLTVPDAGTYLVEVFSFAGSSNYVLSIGQTQTVPPRGLVGSLEFVPGEVIVQLDESASSAAETVAKIQTLGIQAKAGAPEREMLMGIGQMMMLRAAGTTKLAAADGDHHRLAFSRAGAEFRDKWYTLLAVKEIASRNDVVLAEPNYVLRPSAVADDEYFGLQWHYPMINLPSAWDVPTIGSPIVAVIDTGILLGHPDLQGILVPGFDFIRDASRAGDGDGLDTNPDDVGDELFGGSSFHGTHVAGTVAAATNNQIGVAGIATNARIMPIRVLGMDGGTSYDVLQAVRYAAGLPNDSGTVPSQRADVINLSLSGTSASQVDQSVYTQARAQGVIVIAAAGNGATNAPSYPASYSGVVSVSAVNISGTLSSYSNFGPTVDVAAPGGDFGDFNGDGYPDGVLSTGGDDSFGFIGFNYRFMSGTSMAAPHVAGVAALMKAVSPALTSDEFDSLLSSGALTMDLGAAGRDDFYGQGLIDASKAVHAAASGIVAPPVPALSINPASLNFGATLASIELIAADNGDGLLVLNVQFADAPWLSIAPAIVDSSGLGSYVVSVDRRNLAVGTYSGTILFTSTANAVEVPVIMQVSDHATDGDAGYHYVLLIDPDTGLSIYQDDVGAERGTYSYQFTDVAAGVYQIFAGTDFDNDGAICDPGEACGAYLSLDQAATLNVAESVNGIDFATGFEVAIAAGAELGSERQRATPKRIR